eukprot:scaffold10.g2305.t1
MSGALRTADDVFVDYAGRRRGILKALVTDADNFYNQCDPVRENLCLYGYADGTYEVAMPAEEVPPELPEPSIGINFARDGMKRHDWLSLVAVHADSWLMAVAFYNAARLGINGRRQLFNDINQLPTCYEVVSGRAAAARPAAPAARPAAAPAAPAPGAGAKRQREGGGADEEASDGPN